MGCSDVSLTEDIKEVKGIRDCAKSIDEEVFLELLLEMILSTNSSQRIVENDQSLKFCYLDLCCLDIS